MPLSRSFTPCIGTEAGLEFVIDNDDGADRSDAPTKMMQMGQKLTKGMAAPRAETPTKGPSKTHQKTVLKALEGDAMEQEAPGHSTGDRTIEASESSRIFFVTIDDSS